MSDLPEKNSLTDTVKQEQDERKLDERLIPESPPGEVPDIGDEYTTFGVDKAQWTEPPRKRHSYGT